MTVVAAIIAKPPKIARTAEIPFSKNVDRPNPVDSKKAPATMDKIQ